MRAVHKYVPPKHSNTVQQPKNFNIHIFVKTLKSYIV
jgi:hypothetical protein